MIKWDGSNLGNIDNIVVDWKRIEKTIILYLNDGSKALIYKYINAIPLIADELKCFFGIKKIGRHRATYKKTDILLCKMEDDTVILKSPRDILKKDKENINSSDVKKCYLFRWCLGLTCIGDNLLLILNRNGSQNVTSNYEHKYNYDDKKSNKFTDIVIRTWFNNYNNISIEMNKLFSRNDILSLRFEMEKIIKNIDQSYILWLHNIILRIDSKLH